jgi:hypothetical protein
MAPLSGPACLVTPVEASKSGQRIWQEIGPRQDLAPDVFQQALPAMILFGRGNPYRHPSFSGGGIHQKAEKADWSTPVTASAVAGAIREVSGA